MYPCTCLLYFLFGLPNLKSTTTTCPSCIITLSGRRVCNTPSSLYIMAHSLNNCQRPEYQSCISGMEKALWVTFRISSSTLRLPITPSKISLSMAVSMSFSVSIAENRVCSKRPRLIKRSSDSSSSIPLIKSAERLDCRNSISCRIDSMLTGSLSGFRVNLLVETFSSFFEEGQSSPCS